MRQLDSNRLTLAVRELRDAPQRRDLGVVVKPQVLGRYASDALHRCRFHYR
jgi:hypothetical protein